jgi:hypothetical protein
MILLFVFVVGVLLYMYPSGVASLDKVHTDTTGNAADEEIAKAVVDATAKDTSQLGSSDAVVEKGMHDGLDSAADLTAQAHAEMMKLLDMDILVVPPNSLNWIPQTKELEGILAILREHANNTIRNIEQLLSTFRIGGMEFSDGRSSVTSTSSIRRNPSMRLGSSSEF